MHSNRCSHTPDKFDKKIRNGSPVVAVSKVCYLLIVLIGILVSIGTVRSVGVNVALRRVFSGLLRPLTS